MLSPPSWPYSTVSFFAFPLLLVLISYSPFIPSSTQSSFFPYFFSRINYSSSDSSSRANLVFDLMNLRKFQNTTTRIKAEANILATR
jgi:hypothetical protein